MTRLTEEMLQAINLKELDSEAQRKTGKSIRRLAAEVAGLSEPLPARQQKLFAVVPVSAGQGVINGFVEKVAEVLAFLGLTVKRSRQPDVAGLSEAASAGAEIVFMADDNKFIALNLKRGTYVDNAAATAEMYVYAVSLMAKGMLAKKTLLIGLGNVGEACLKACLRRGANLLVYDQSAERTRQKAEQYGVVPARNLLQVCAEAEIIIDASPAQEVIRETWLSDGVIVGAPGIPLGLQVPGHSRLQDRMIHDCLALGVAGMAAMSLAQGLTTITEETN